MVDPEERWRAVIYFIEGEFGITIEPPEGITGYYDGCMEGWTEQIRETNPDITENDVRAYMPFEKFNGYGKGEIGEAVRKVLDHFKDQTDEIE